MSATMTSAAKHGLANVGNTCYLNSAFQCLRFTKVFREYLGTDAWQKHRHEDRKGYEFAGNVAELVAAMQTPGDAMIHPRRFVVSFVDVAKTFNNLICLGAQADADEAIHIILDSLHTQLSREVRIEP